MRIPGRLGVIAATTALAGTTLAGGGVAGAQSPLQWRIDSPSTVSVSRGEGAALVLSHANRAGRDLLCHAYVGVDDTVQNLYDVHVRWGISGRLNVLASQSDLGVISYEISRGRGDTAMFTVADGASGPVAFVQREEGEGGETAWVPAPPPELPDTSFRPEVVTVCVPAEEGDGPYTYGELEWSELGAAPLGSLGDVGSAFGS